MDVVDMARSSVFYTPMTIGFTNGLKLNGKMTSVDGIHVYVPFSTHGNKDTVLLIHEWWGLNEQTMKWADDFAKLGYQAAALDLFDRQVTSDRAVAARQMEQANPAECWNKLSTVIDWLPRKDGLEARRIVTVGWCFGGGWSLQCALRKGNMLAGSIIYYGQLETDPKKLEGCRTPLLGIFARKDNWITLGMVNQFEHACREAKVPHEIHIYDADHAFNNPANASYNAVASKDSWEKTTAFLKRVMA